jgi:hypothetical protein
MTDDLEYSQDRLETERYRVTKEEKEKIAQAAKIRGITKSKLVRHLLRKEDIIDRD